MAELKILNSREIKEILSMIEGQWGARMKLEYGFLKNNKNRYFIVNREISKIDISKLKLNNVGMYFCEIDAKGIRLSIEGSQIIGPEATKNEVGIEEDEMKRWFMGEALHKECENCSGFVVLKNKNDCLGCGKYSNGKILNYVSKARRISAPHA